MMSATDTPLQQALALLEQAADLLSRKGTPGGAEQAWRWKATALIAAAGNNRCDIETIDLYGDGEWRKFLFENRDALNGDFPPLDEARQQALSSAGLTLGGGAAPLFCIRLYPARAA